MAGFVYFAKSNIYYASIFVVIHIFLDGLDGPLARHQKTASNKGAVTDIIADHAVLLIGVITTAYFHIIDLFWAAVYLASYFLMIYLLIIVNKLKIPVKFVFRSKYWFFIILLIDFHFKTNIIHPFLIILTLYMVILNLHIIQKIIKHYKKEI